MIPNFKRTASLLGVVAAGSLALVACSESETGSESTDATSIEGLSGTTGQLVAEGSSAQQNAMDYFNIKYQEAVPGASLAYNASGSGSGRTNFVAGQVAFGGSDSPLTDEQVVAAAERCEGNDAWHLPLVIGPVTIAYNLEGVDTLNLSTATVAQIFNGEISKWNDEAIAAENEGVELPDMDISVIYRSDESGTTDNFQRFLKAASPENWEGVGQQFPSAVGAGANGSNGVATETNNVEGAITYVEAGFAQQQDLGIANIDFGSGPTELNAETVGVALENLEFLTEGNDMVMDTESMFSMNEEGAYPLVLASYEIVCSAGYDAETSAMVKDFLTVALESQDDDLADQGYIPVTGAHHDRLVAAVEAIQ